MSPVRFFLGISAFAWAEGFLRYIGRPIFVNGARVVPFPVFPNVLDVIGMALVGSYLLYETIDEARKIQA